jgi:hypothetical protein
MPPTAPQTAAAVIAGGWSSGPLLALAVAVVVAAATYAQRPPPVVGATAPAGAFSAERAAAHLAFVAAESHPIGSAANRRVRDGLLDALVELGLQTELQRTAVVGRRHGGTAIVENVLGRLPGTVGGAAVLLVAHYDSVPGAPGAADNGAAVAAVLETFRALRHGPPLANDVLVLFSDGEEVGLLGAEAFVAEHPWMADVGMVLNFEARGSSGPSVLVETSGESRELIRAFAAVVPYPNASSFASAVYELLPNDTDFSVFEPLGVPGFNFAFIRDAAHYHTRRDAITRLDLRSLQHHGEHMLALARHFGDADLERAAFTGGDSVYVDVLRRWLLHYPASLALPLALASLVGWALVTGLARRRRHLRLRAVLGGALALLAALVVAAAEGLGAVALLGALQPALATRWLVAPYQVETTMLGLSLLAVLSTLLVAGAARRRIAPLALALGGLLVFVALALAASAWLPGASYLPTLPALGLLVAIAPIAAGRRAPGTAPWHPWALLAGALPGLLLLPPFIAEGFIGVGLPLAAAVLALVTLGTWLLTPLLGALRRPHAWWLPGLLAAASIATLGLGAARAAFGPQQPRPSNAFYAVDPERAIALFGSLQDEPDAWTARFVDAAPAPAEHASWLLPTMPPERFGAAPVLDLPQPRLELLADEEREGERRLTLRIAAGREATALVLLVSPPAARSFRFEGLPAPLARVGGWLQSMTFGPPPEGVVVGFSVDADTEVEVMLASLSAGLLELPGVPARPEGLMADPTYFGDAVLVSRRWLLDRRPADEAP